LRESPSQNPIAGVNCTSASTNWAGRVLKIVRIPSPWKYDNDRRQIKAKTNRWKVWSRFFRRPENMQEIPLLTRETMRGNSCEVMQKVFEAECAAWNYRKKFSKAYRVLFKDGCLCYLTEILDSAQEGSSILWLIGFPFLWVNGEKYVFSQEVLEAGTKLFNAFCKIQHFIRNIYNV
jgi:hypothetical protein